MQMMSFSVAPLDQGMSFKAKAYQALRQAITQMDIYGGPSEIRLDERQLCEALGVSRTPVREAMALLEQEGFIRSMPRRGIFVVRKTKAEIIEMITVCAALEGMAARLFVERADERGMADLHATFDRFAEGELADHVLEYSDANVAFHQSIIQASGCTLIADLTDRFFIHMRAIRRVTMRRGGRAETSIVEHRDIIDALTRRDADLAERRVREHTLGLARHVEQHCDFLD
ncbi:GntR family transcriptional regulator [Azospirillum sp. TSH58]|uniref:GntR family transcriptional regulator n=1 Tax=Azospirillum brasilense TaxID=192 RepID=A0A4D8R0P2_AZOBR|nr:GntR family transcriptional regulator [Azospirillum brasilense]AWJ82965.1 GntR family transcriptional regulator [Azospirillum sp. TSH58]QCO16207.1 GntR family transcriptional regulator [Azospirillum brasilense]